MIYKNTNKKPVFRVLVIWLALMTLSVFGLFDLLIGVDSVISSHKSGYYNESIKLKLSHSGIFSSIRYTLDGSMPTKFSNKYDGPIELTKNTFLRAQVFTISGRKLGDYSQYTFLFDEIPAYKTVAIETDKDYLWDENKGIYAYNYEEKGPEWNRKASVSVMDKTGELVFKDWVQLSLHGGRTRRTDQKSMKICGSKDYGYTYMKYDFFDDNTYPNCVLLRNGGNEWVRSFFKDAYAQTLVDDYFKSTQRVEPAIVYLNGDYWGIHNIRDEINEEYLKNMYGGKLRYYEILMPDKENNGIPKVEKGDESSAQRYQDFLKFLRENSLESEENYKIVSNFIDIDNFIDYFVIETYLANADWPDSNLRLWRYKQDYITQNVTPLDGRYRWIIYDLDASLDTNYVDQKIFKYLKYQFTESKSTRDWSVEIIFSLLENEHFRQKLITRYYDYINFILSPKVAETKLEEINAIYKIEMENHINRWKNSKDGWGDSPPQSIEEWQKHVEEIKSFLNIRLEKVKGHLEEYFDFNTYKISINIKDMALGDIYINGILIDEPYIKVEYPENSKLILKAVPKQGYKFTGWSQNIPSEIGEIIIEKDIQLEPTFE